MPEFIQSEIPASGGASINNDTEGFGWFTGVATGICPWRSPTIGFRAAPINDALIDGGDNLDVNVALISEDSTAADNLEAAFDGTGYDLGGIDVSELNSIVDDWLDGGRLDLLIDALPLLAEITGGAYALDTDANGRIRIVDGSGAGELLTTSGLIDGMTGIKNTLDDLNDISTAQVNSEADTALSDYDPPTYDELEGFFQLALRSDAGIETDRSALLSALNADEGSGAGDYSSQNGRTGSDKRQRRLRLDNRGRRRNHSDIKCLSGNS